MFSNSLSCPVSILKTPVGAEETLYSVANASKAERGCLLGWRL